MEVCDVSYVDYKISPLLVKVIYTSNQKKDIGAVWDISDLCHDIDYYTDIGDQAGKLTMTVEREPYATFQLNVGSAITLIVDFKHIFTGFIFTLESGLTNEVKVTCYDAKRYLKNKDVVQIQKGKHTINTFFSELMMRCGVKHGFNVLCSSMTFLPEQLFVDKTYYEMLQWCFDYLFDHEQKLYFISVDGMGMIELNEIKTMQLKHSSSMLFLTPSSIVTDFKLEQSIDKGTCNKLICYTENKKGLLAWKEIEQDLESVSMYGVLSETRVFPVDTNPVVAKQFAPLFLALRKNAKVNISMSAIGYDKIRLVAGMPIRFSLPAQGFVDVDMYIKAITHHYKNGVHTMDLNFAEYPTLVEIKEVKLKPLNDIVQEVIDGLWGNEPDRYTALSLAHYDWRLVQNAVNERLGNPVRH